MLALLVYAVASAVTFIAYGLDKRAARSGRQRTSESTLLSLGLLCGWPGALLGQWVFRHKTAKRSFRRAFWGTVVLNVIALVVVVTVLHFDLLGSSITL